MKCRAFDNVDTGAFICIFNSKCLDINLTEKIKESEAIHSELVFFDECYVFDALSKQYAYPGRFKGNIDVHLIGCASDELLAQLRRFQSDGLIRNLMVSYADLYKIKRSSKTWIGSEMWGYYDKPIGLYEMVQDEVRYSNDTVRFDPYIEQIVKFIKQYCPINDLEKILLLDIWFQQHIQFAEGKVTSAPDGKYICEAIEGITTCSDFFLRHLGCCRHFAFAASLVLNHPEIAVPCRTVQSQAHEHSWNIVSCNGKDYYVDYSRNVSRNPYRVKGALKAKSYCCNYTLLGIEDVKSEYSYAAEYDFGPLSLNSFSREIIDSTLMNLCNRGAHLSWDIPLTTPSIHKGN